MIFHSQGPSGDVEGEAQCSEGGVEGEAPDFQHLPRDLANINE